MTDVFISFIYFVAENDTAPKLSRAGIERIFSSMALILSNLRNRLTSEQVAKPTKVYRYRIFKRWNGWQRKILGYIQKLVIWAILRKCIPDHQKLKINEMIEQAVLCVPNTLIFDIQTEKSNSIHESWIFSSICLPQTPKKSRKLSITSIWKMHWKTKFYSFFPK